MKKIGKITCEKYGDTGFDFSSEGSFTGTADTKEEALAVVAACRLYDELIPGDGVKRSGEMIFVKKCHFGSWYFLRGGLMDLMQAQCATGGAVFFAAFSKRLGFCVYAASTGDLVELPIKQ